LLLLFPSSTWVAKNMQNRHWKITGTKLISACGNINKPGVYEIDMTISVEEFIYSDEYCGGIPNGKKLKACIPGGSSVPILPANLIMTTAKGETR
jgi:NADH-quinone oxidoreductase subunit F